MKRIEAVVGEGPSLRADVYIATILRIMTRSQLKSRSAALTVGGRAAKLSRSLKPGERFCLTWEEDSPRALAAEDIPLAVIFENGDAIVVNKPQGMVCHPANGNWNGTLVNALLWRAKERGLAYGAGPDDTGGRPGIVHRLDKDTSGVIIAAWNPEAHAFLSAQFAARATGKRYLAVVKGLPPLESGSLETLLARDPTDRKRFAISNRRGKIAVSHYRVMRSFPSGHALLSLEPRTGRTHQLRVHMRHLGCPIVGDSIYGKKDRDFPDATLMLHAYRLKIRLPGEETPRTFQAPLPKRFSDMLEILEKK